MVHAYGWCNFNLTSIRVSKSSKSDLWCIDKIEWSYEEKDPIDITGEDAVGGTSSRIFACDRCDYKASRIQNLSDHKKTKHEAVVRYVILLGKPRMNIRNM